MCIRDRAETWGIDGNESFSIELNNSLEPRGNVNVTIKKQDGSEISKKVLCRIDSPVEPDYYKDGGILRHVLRVKAFG